MTQYYDKQMLNTIRLGDAATYINGYAFKPEDRGAEGLPIIRIQDLTGHAYDLGFYTGRYPGKIEINDGDVLISWSASLGVYIWDRGKALLNQHIFKVVFDKREIDKRYFVYAVRHKLQEMESKTHGATMKHIVKKEFDDILIPYPDIDVQCEIADRIEKIEGVVKKRKKEIQLLDEFIKSLFVEMFGDPNTNPFGWEIVSLDECLESIDNGKSFVCDNNPRIGTDPAILKLSAVTCGIYKPEENKAILDKNDFVENDEVHEGDLLFTRKNTPELVGMSAYVSSTPAKLMMPDLIFRLNTRDNCSKIFLWKLINHDLFRSRIQKLASGSAKSMSNISKERLSRLKLALPPIALQEQFATFVEQIDKSIFVIQQSINELEILIASQMQKYFGWG